MIYRPRLYKTYTIYRPRFTTSLTWTFTFTVLQRHLSIVTYLGTHRAVSYYGVIELILCSAGHTLSTNSSTYAHVCPLPSWYWPTLACKVLHLTCSHVTLELFQLRDSRVPVKKDNIQIIFPVAQIWNYPTVYVLHNLMTIAYSSFRKEIYFAEINCMRALKNLQITFLKPQLIASVSWR